MPLKDSDIQETGLRLATICRAFDLRSRIQLGRAMVWCGLLYFAFKYVSPSLLADFNADLIIPANTYRSFIEHGYSLEGWCWGGASFLFPDIIVSWLFIYITADGLMSLQIASAMLFLCWVAAVTSVYSAVGGSNKDAFAGFAVLLGAIFDWHRGLRWPLGHAFFVCCYHGAAMVVSLACLALTVSYLARQKGSTYNLWGMSTLLVLAVSSDAIMITWFVLPVLVTLGIHMTFFPKMRRNLLETGAHVVVSSAAGLLVKPLLFPIPIATGYTSFNLDGAWKASCEFLSELCSPIRPIVACLLAIEILTFLLCIDALLFGRRQDQRGVSFSGRHFLFCVSAACIAFSWGGGVFTGNYTGIDCLRYESLALALPFVLFIVYLSELPLWTRGRVLGLQSVVAVTVVLLGMHLPTPSSDYIGAIHSISPIRDVMKRKQIKFGLGDYWNSREITYLSNGEVQLSEINSEGGERRWFNDLHEYTGWRNQQGAPEFRAIFMKGINPDAIRKRFGSPDEVASTPGNADIWVYSPENAIRYSIVFNELLNRHTSTSLSEICLHAADLPRSRGQIENNSVVVRTARDQSGYVTFGPYLRLPPGRYRVGFGYAYEKPPLPGMESRCNCSLNGPCGPVVLDEVPLPWPGNSGAHVLNRWITVPKLKNTLGLDQCSMEAKTYYHGSGDLRIDSLAITSVEH